MLFFDHINASIPLAGPLREMQVWLGRAANPQTDHAWGRRAHTALEEARAEVTDLISAPPASVLFGATGTELLNLAVKGVLKANRRKGRHVLLTRVEHPAVDRACRRMQDEGWTLTWLDVAEDGRVDPMTVAAALTPDTALVCVQLANPEVGCVQPVAEISRHTSSRRIPLLVDAVAAAGRLPLAVESLGCDLLVLSADSLWSPPGAAALYVRPGLRIQPEIDGGVQENGRRSGRENLPAIVALGNAAHLTHAELAPRMAHLETLAERLRLHLAALPGIHLTGPAAGPWRLPGHVSFLVPGADGQSLLALLDARGVAASSGSFCGAMALKASPVLTAMGYPADRAGSGVVFSMGPENTLAEVDEGAKRLRECILECQSALKPRRG
ncbi:MAG: cysteine desulfurase [Nitrospirota bacterium]|nr:cysteine desulfurase [Nitrospirota bacterium]